jgi:hypothetical protein
MLVQECDDECECISIILNKEKLANYGQFFYFMFLFFIKSDLPYPP